MNSKDVLYNPQSIQVAIRDQLGLAVEQLEEIKIAPTANSVFQGVLEDQQVIVRFSAGRNSFPIETWVYAQFESLGIPAPKVLVCADKLSAIGQPVIVMTKLTGQKLKDLPDEEKLSYYEQIGQLVKKIHTIKVDKFGWLRHTQDGCMGGSNSWPEYWQDQDYPTVLQYLVEHNLISHDEEQRLSKNFAEFSSMDLSQGYLLHGDLNAENFIVHNGSISGIIDPEHSLSGDPRLDIANTYMWQTNEQRQAFERGYGELAKDKLVGQYHLWVASSKLAYRHKNGRESGVTRGRLALDKALSDLIQP